MMRVDHKSTNKIDQKVDFCAIARMQLTVKYPSTNRFQAVNNPLVKMNCRVSIAHPRMIKAIALFLATVN